MIVLLVLMFAVLTLFDIPKLVKEKSWRDLVATSAILAVAFAAMLLQVLDIDVFNPVRETQHGVKWLFEQIGLSYD